MEPTPLEQLQRKIDELTRKVEQLSSFLDTSPAVRTLYVGDGKGLVRLAGGQSIFVDVREPDIARSLMLRGVWEADNSRMLRKLVAPNATCFDIGANYGYFALLLHAIVRGKGRVYAFEPNPQVFECLALSIKPYRHAGSLRAFQVALGSRESVEDLYFDPSIPGGGSILFSEMVKKTGKLSSSSVKVTTLDKMFGDIDMEAPIFIKMDVEGAEYGVLRGAQNLIEKAHNLTVMLEFTPAFIAREVSVKEYVGWLQDCGFSFFCARQGDLQEMSVTDVCDAPNMTLFLQKKKSKV